MKTHAFAKGIILFSGNQYTIHNEQNEQMKWAESENGLFGTSTSLCAVDPGIANKVLRLFIAPAL